MRTPALAFLASAFLAFGLTACPSDPVAEPCGPENCNGCCTLDGQCQSGDTAFHCGSAGETCSVCIANQTCVSGNCILLVGDAGQDPDGGEDPDAGMDPDAGTEPDGGTEGDGGTEPDGGIPTGPIDVPQNAWTWVAFPDAVCGNGAATGIGVNPTSASNDLFIYMQGGGACWDSLTCFLIKSASNLETGYGQSQFNSAPERGMFAVDRTQAQNPFRDMSYVFIPYCTGDVHAGDAVQTYGSNPPVHHKGGKNLDAFLQRLVPTFPNAQRIILSGSSAGGFGALLNYERVRAAFPNAEVHVLADSAQMINPASDRLSQWLAAWNFTIPPACTNCTTDFTLYPEYLHQTYPDRRFALTAYDQDGTLSFFFGHNQQDYQTYQWALLAQRYDPYPNAAYFALSGNAHTMMGDLGTLAAPDGTLLRNWVQQFVDGDAAWDDVNP